MAQRLRIRVTPPTRDPVTKLITAPGEVKVQEIAADGTIVSTWPQSLVESIADMRLAVRPNGDSRVRILFEAGFDQLQIETPKLDGL